MKERLIGAVVLVGIGAWLIPWVLDGPPQLDGSEPASLELPVPDEPLPLRTQTIRLDDRGASTTPEPRPARPVPADTSADTRQAAPPAPDDATDAARADATGTDATPDDGARAGATSADDAAAAAEPRSAASPSEEDDSARAAVSRDEPAAPAQSATPSQPRDTRTAAAPAATGDWAVQLGSFGEEQNAQRLAGRVATQGYSPTITNVRAGGRLLHRVRVGPFETRESAQEAASELSAQGFVGQVVGAD